MARLTIKQKAFIEHYLTTGIATEAARLAGYKGDYNTLAAVGSENLKKPKILDEIEKRLLPAKMTANEVLIRLGEQARSDYADYIKTVAGLPYVDFDAIVNDGKAYLIKKIKRSKLGYEVEFYDAQTALGLLAKHHNLLSADKQQINIVVKLQRAIESGQVSAEEAKARWPSLAQQLFESVTVDD